MPIAEISVIKSANPSSRNVMRLPGRSQKTVLWQMKRAAFWLKWIGG